MSRSPQEPIGEVVGGDFLTATPAAFTALSCTVVAVNPVSGIHCPMAVGVLGSSPIQSLLPCTVGDAGGGRRGGRLLRGWRLMATTLGHCCLHCPLRPSPKCQARPAPFGMGPVG